MSIGRVAFLVCLLGAAFGCGDDATAVDAGPPAIGGPPGRTLALGSAWTCVLEPDREQRVRCWGRHIRSAVPGVRSGPTDFPELRGAIEIAGGDGMLCGRFADGRVRCSDIQQDEGWFPERSVGFPWVPGLNDAQQIVAGSHFACALRYGGRIACWGDSRKMKLGSVQTGVVSTPVEVPGIREAWAVAASGTVACALTSDRSLRCWGEDQLYDPLKRETGPVELPGFRDVESLTVGGLYCASDRRGTVRCAGWNGFGGIGDGTTETRMQPVEVRGLPPIATVAATGSTTCALTRGHDLHCWGKGEEGLVGAPRVDRHRPPSEPLLRDVAEVALGGSHACARKRSGEVVCWGDDGGGAVTGSSGGESPPRDVRGIDDAIDIVEGHRFLCALRRSGRVWCWGQWTVMGAQGVEEPPLIDSSVPVEIAGLTDVRGVAAGAWHLCALGGDGLVRCLGGGPEGQLGTGPGRSSRTPVVVPGVRDATQIDSGGDHTCVLTRTGSVWCWGELDRATQDGPTLIPDVARATKIALSSTGGCARLTSGAVRCWDTGQRVSSRFRGTIGLGNLGSPRESRGLRSYPVVLVGRALDFDVGAEHACAITSGIARHGIQGGLVCWALGQTEPMPWERDCMFSLGTRECPGADAPAPFTHAPAPARFQLSGGTTCIWRSATDGVAECSAADAPPGPPMQTPTRPRLARVPVAGPVSRVLIDVTDCVLRPHGTITCWGYNEEGQVGAGISRYVTEPVPAP